ncbi:MAG TPA: YggT family protein [Bellilinea sp.]
MTEYKEVHTEQRELGQTNRVTTFKVTQLIWLLFGLLEAAIGLRVIFKLIAVNPSNPFAAFLYRVTDLFLAPFQSLIGSPAAEGMVLEVSSIIAMIVYALIAWALDRLAYVLFYRPRGGVSVSRTVVADHTQPPPPDIEDRPL